MLNAIWLGMIFLSVLVGFIQGRLDLVVQAITDSAKLGFEIAFGLIGIMAFWLGLAGVAQVSGLMDKIANFLKPALRRLFSDIPEHDPALGALTMNITANMLGLTNAATPFGIHAMHALQRLNEGSKEASNAMCTFLAINTSSVQLIPVTAIAFLTANHSQSPNSVIVTTLFATTCSTLVAMTSVKALEALPYFRRKERRS